MRRLLPIAVLAATLIGIAACSDGPDPDAGAAASPSVTSAAPAPTASGGATAGRGTPDTASSVPAGGNARQVCVAVQKKTSESVMVFVTELGRMMQASADNDTRAAQDAKRKAEAALAGWGRAVREEAAKATDPRLKSVLAEIGAEVGAMKAELDGVNQSKLDELQQRLDQLCAA
ncbi:hypothetical protein SAMN05444365_108145 [Micromonospora pattaloongensis]|uniref:Lipoprotein n=1 Tax=Micromonospora pattaloongensis TaxID=405436 RepID=A0A1H3RNX1_9ACTN|nr:hypothetical protein [Micromonospora pattaloongensis]SDZ26599.1 hypothetical protein SAMN05444365_108145 [Micromonospora pattaloongensis]